jgi:hypothetical protein
MDEIPLHVSVVRSLFGLLARPLGGPLRRFTPGLCGLLIAFALGRWSAQAPVRISGATDATQSAEALSRSLDQLEARLTESSAWVSEETDLRRRHEAVSELACASAAAHLRDMTRLADAHRHHPPSPAADQDEETSRAPAPGGPPSLAGRRLASVRPSDGSLVPHR